MDWFILKIMEKYSANRTEIFAIPSYGFDNSVAYTGGRDYIAVQANMLFGGCN